MRGSIKSMCTQPPWRSRWMATSVPENPPPTMMARRGSVVSDKVCFVERHGEMGGGPGIEAAEHVQDGFEAIGFEQAAGDGAAIAAFAIDGDGLFGIEIGKRLAQCGEWGR